MSNEKAPTAIAEGTPVTIATLVQQPVAPDKDPIIHLGSLAVYLGIVVAVLTVVGLVGKWLSDRRGEDREWTTIRITNMTDKLSDDIRETRADVKETERRLYDVEQQRAADREKIIVLEKDMSHLKDGVDRIEKVQLEMAKDQKTYFSEMAESIRHLRLDRPQNK
jgi:Mg2+ and Co2+ transporter CorA